MLADASTVPMDEIISTDVCVVGAGPAGVTIARHLGAAGYEVVLLERGTRTGPPPGPPDTAVNVGTPYDLESSRSFQFGGALQRWLVKTPLGEGFGRLRELDAIDFEKRSWVPYSGWPFGKRVLEPFYARAWSLFSEKWPSDTPQRNWDTELRSTGFCSAPSQIEIKVFGFANPAVFPGEFARSLDNSESVLVLTSAAVTDILCEDSSSHVSSLEVRTHPAHRFFVQARAYVLAAGGIENARLLLTSQGRHPEGLGNSRGMVGRFFMEHPHYASGRLVPRHRATFDCFEDFAIHLRDGIPIQKKYSLPDEVVRSEELAGCVFRFEPKPVTDSVHTLRYSERANSSIAAAISLGRSIATRQLPGDARQRTAVALRGSHHVARYAANRARVYAGRRLGLHRYTRPQMFWIRAMAEQVPNPDSRVRLGTSRDHYGIPVAELDWRMTETDTRSIQRSQELLGRALLSSGHQRVESLVSHRPVPPALSGGKHHMGTTRMSESPSQGVVNADCRVHDVRNLYIAGSSVFPTVGYANPTLTILALSLRLSDHLATELRETGSK